MKNRILVLTLAFSIGFVILSCRGKATITPTPGGNTASNRVDFVLKGDFTKQMSLSYMDGYSKHYLKIYSLIDTLKLDMQPPSQDTLIGYGNFRTIELFYRGSDTLLYSPSSLSNVPININNFTVEVYDTKHSLVSTHNLYFKVFAIAALKTANGFKYDVKWDNIELQKSPQYQSTGINRGRVGFTVN